MKKVFIVAAKRSAVGKFGGTLSSLTAPKIASIVLKNMLDETKVDASEIDEVVVGNVLSAGNGQNVARQSTINAGIPNEVPAFSLNMVCGSGMKAIANAFSSIRAGEANLIIAGGTESMSNAPFLLSGQVRNGIKMGNFSTIDHMIQDGLWDAFNDYHMGVTAENIAVKYDISREEQDAFSVKSQERAAKAQDAGSFKSEIVPIEIATRKETIIFDTDEHLNRGSSLEKLAKLRPAFKKDGTVTAGNASGINDGASFVMLASEEMIEKYNLTPLVEVVAVGQGGVDPSVMGLGPVPAIADVLRKANIKLTDIDVLELNEAFAAQSLGVIKQLCVDHGVEQSFFDERCNKNGGAIALGHPIGASGNRIVVTLIHEMKRQNNIYGLASLCIGGGMGTAIVLKNVK